MGNSSVRDNHSFQLVGIPGQSLEVGASISVISDLDSVHVVEDVFLLDANWESLTSQK